MNWETVLGLSQRRGARRPASQHGSLPTPGLAQSVCSSGRVLSALLALPRGSVPWGAVKTQCLMRQVWGKEGELAFLPGPRGLGEPLEKRSPR